MRMSYSSAGLQDTCSRKYYHEKLAKTAADSDFNEDSDALLTGSAYHKVLEVSNHVHTKFSLEILDAACVEFRRTQEDKLKIYACLTAYYTLRQKSQLSCVACEVELGSEADGFIGYVDALVADKNGFWWVLDLKTAGTWVEGTIARLPEDRQLSLYARYKDDLAHRFSLNPAQFAGVRYCAVIKPRHIPKSGETMKAYATRADAKIHEIPIPHYLLNPDEAWEWVQGRRHYAMTLGLDASQWEQNRKSCMDYQRPCKFWSQCHNGRSFTDSLGWIEDLTIENMKDQTLTELPSAKNFALDVLSI